MPTNTRPINDTSIYTRMGTRPSYGQGERLLLLTYNAPHTVIDPRYYDVYETHDNEVLVTFYPDGDRSRPDCYGQMSKSAAVGLMWDTLTPAALAGRSDATRYDLRGPIYFAKYSEFISEVEHGPSMWLSVIEDGSGYTLHSTETEAENYASKFNSSFVLRLDLP